ncbi:VanZ family protein [candidate division KSB1 bacterium]
MRKFLRYYIPVLFWIFFIYLSSYLLKDNSISRSILHLDKVVHFFEYGILGFLFLRAIYYSQSERELPRSLLTAFGITIFFAAFDELHQIYVPGRTASFMDFAADFAGIIAAIFVFRYIVKKTSILE